MTIKVLIVAANRIRNMDQGSILQKFYTSNSQVQLLLSARETIATLVKYKCKIFITLTPGQRRQKQLGQKHSMESSTSMWVAVAFDLVLVIEES